jgi:hypothetical protein
VGICVSVLLLILTTACADPEPGFVAPPVMTLSVPDRASSTPWIASDGNFIAVAWAATTADGKTDVYAATSRDGGRSFAPPVRVNDVVGEARLVGESPPRIALRRRPGANAPDVVVVWTGRDTGTSIKQARSIDGGQTFGRGEVLTARDAAGNRGWAALALDNAGTPHTVWLDHRAMASPAHKHVPGAERSAADAVAMAQKSALFYAIGTSSERELTRGVCYCCKTALAASGGVVAAAWRHVYEGNLRDIAFSLSRDGGRTFSDPVRVSEDRWSLAGCPDDGPAIAIDGRGAVHVVWPTMLPGEPAQGAIFYARTTDGRTFTPRVRVPTLGGRKPSHPQIAVDPSGRIAIAWDESLDGARVAAVRFVESDAGGPEFSSDVRLGTNGIALYPVLASASDGVIAAWTQGGNASSIAVQRVQPARRP